MYIWGQPGWPRFEWDAEALIAPLGETRLKQGRLLGRMQALGFDLQLEAELQALTAEAVKSSDIEGEVLDAASVRSSLARRLGLPDAAAAVDRRAEGLAEMLLDATRNHTEPLTAERLFAWQAALFPTGYSGLARLRIGAWRDDAGGPTQVVSGALGRERVHYEAPPAARLEAEMAAFLDWFETPAAMDGLLKAGLAHLWFVTIHPFEDGNGRIARAIADLALARSEASPQRFYSLSSQIRRERAAYYAELEAAQKGGLDVTRWLAWFLASLGRALDGAEAEMAGVLRKAEFWRARQGLDLNPRQRLVLNRWLDGFEGRLTAPKWAILAKCSPATAQRDIADLLDKGVLIRNPGGGKNTSYAVAD